MSRETDRDNRDAWDDEAKMKMPRDSDELRGGSSRTTSDRHAGERNDRDHDAIISGGNVGGASFFSARGGDEYWKGFGVDPKTG